MTISNESNTEKVVGKYRCCLDFLAQNKSGVGIERAYRVRPKNRKKNNTKIIPLLNVAEFSLFKDGQKSQIGSPTDRNRLNSDATDVRHLPKILGLILLLVEVTTGETGQNVAQKKIVVVVTLKFH